MTLHRRAVLGGLAASPAVLAVLAVANAESRGAAATQALIRRLMARAAAA